MRVWSILAVLLSSALCVARAQAPADVRTGSAAYGDWRQDAPGVRRHIAPADMPQPRATPVGAASAHIVARPAGAMLAAPPGFSVEQFAAGLSQPRTLRFAPNGDLFVAETGQGRILVLGAGGASGPMRRTIFASGLGGLFGLAFYPADKPRYVYAATPTRVVRFAYASGDEVARGAPEIVVDGLPDGGHTTRDIVFSRDGRTMYLSVGSRSNDAAGMDEPPAELAAFEQANGLGASWGAELGRADVLAFDAQGGRRRVVAAGLRNCVAMALRPASDELWCAVNERDLLGDDLPPDYLTHVQDGAFYGWPWFYIGDHGDPGHPGLRPDLANRVTTPDVLIQPHSAPLGVAFYEGGRFPAEYDGDAFVALHGSWNRTKRTGYKIIRLRFENGRATGEYEDFVTGFVASDADIWGRPVSLAIGPDGALYFSDDGGGAIWRVGYGAR